MDNTDLIHGGYVLTKDSVEEADVPEPGDVMTIQGVDYAVLTVSGMYKIERGEWQIVVKLGQIREASIYGDNPPAWVIEAVYGIEVKGDDQ